MIALPNLGPIYIQESIQRPLYNPLNSNFLLLYSSFFVTSFSCLNHLVNLCLILQILTAHMSIFLWPLEIIMGCFWDGHGGNPHRFVEFLGFRLSFQVLNSEYSVISWIVGNSFWWLFLWAYDRKFWTSIFIWPRNIEIYPMPTIFFFFLCLWVVFIPAILTLQWA